MTTLLNKSGRFATAKRWAVCAAVAFLSVGAMAQMSDWEKLANMNMKGVTYTHINKSMIDQAAEKKEAIKFGNMTVVNENGLDILQFVDDVQVYMCEEAKPATKFARKVKAILKKGKYQSLVDVNNEDNIVKVCQSKEGEKILNIIFVEEKDEEDTGWKDVTLVLIDGTFDITKFLKM